MEQIIILSAVINKESGKEKKGYGIFWSKDMDVGNVKLRLHNKIKFILLFLKPKKLQIFVAMQSPVGRKTMDICR